MATGSWGAPGLVPAGSDWNKAYSPLLKYEWAPTYEALRRFAGVTDGSPYDGVLMEYVNPQTGGSPMPTIGTFMQKLPAGFAGKPWRQTDGTVFSVVEGQGEVEITHGEKTWRFAFDQRDHFVVPSWHTARLSSPGGCVLFSFSDRPVHQALAIHREERLS